MIWFGGITNELSDKVFHARLTVECTIDKKSAHKNISSGILRIKRLRNKLGKFATLKAPDRFFYNQEFFLQEPTEAMVEMGHGY